MSTTTDTTEHNPLPEGAPDIARAIEEVDIEVADAAGAIREHPVVETLGTVSEMADQPPLIIGSTLVLAAGLLARNPRLARAGGRMLASHLLATFIKGQVKQRVDRTRPFVIHEEGRYEVGTQAPRDEGKYNSFPSGHTAGAVAVAEAMIREYPDTASPARLWAGAIALIQVPRCSHYPSDIAAGALVGLAAERAVNFAFDQADQRSRRSTR